MLDNSVLAGYEKALCVLADALSACTRANGRREAILVGGAAATLLTGGAFMSGDFDFLAGCDHDVALVMSDHGFVAEDRHGYLRIGWHHPGHPRFGFQQVSGALMDGRADQARLLRLRMPSDAILVLPAVEDMVADRMGQHAIASPTDTSRLLQARAMLMVHGGWQRDYLVRRVTEEGGDPGLLGDVMQEAYASEASCEDFVSAWARNLGRARALGLVDAEMRNPGTGRTEEKRELLQRMAARARKAGLPPVPGF